jgi:hypothetical protein
MGILNGKTFGGDKITSELIKGNAKIFLCGRKQKLDKEENDGGNISLIFKNNSKASEFFT